MSLMMYHNGVLSADCRVLNLHGSDTELSGFEHHSKLYCSEERDILIGSVGRIPSQQEYAEIRNYIVPLQDDKNWYLTFLRNVEATKLITVDKGGPTVFLFFNGSFFIFRHIDGNYQFQQGDLEKPYVAGAGDTAAVMLIRSKRKVNLTQFYRLVSTTCPMVGTNVDHYDLNTIKGFEHVRSEFVRL